MADGRPSVGIAVAVMPGQRARIERLLIDVAAQSEAAAAVNIVFQETSASEAQSLERDLMQRFPDLPIRAIANAGRGQSQGRNLAIDRCEEDVLFLADDDIGLAEHAVRDMGDAFAAQHGAAVITFRAEWTGGQRRTNYPPAAGPLRTKAAVFPFVSIEMALGVGEITRLGVRFDERFGPGARIATGEEFIFLADVLKHGGEISFVPIVLASHPAASSGRRKLDVGALNAKGAMFARTYGAVGVLVAPAFVGRKVLQRELAVGGLAGVVSSLRGWWDFRREERSMR